MLLNALTMLIPSAFEDPPFMIIYFPLVEPPALPNANYDVGNAPPCRGECGEEDYGMPEQSCYGRVSLLLVGAA